MASEMVPRQPPQLIAVKTDLAKLETRAQPSHMLRALGLLLSFRLAAFWCRIPKSMKVVCSVREDVFFRPQ
jgi:hypothetical protein